MHEIIRPDSVEDTGTTQTSVDVTAPEGLLFHHANEGRPLATPWQVATERSLRLLDVPLAQGFIVDPACGSGLQLCAHAFILNRPTIGIELEPSRAQASALNFQVVAKFAQQLNAPWCAQSRVLAGDGLAAASALTSVNGTATPCVAMLQLDPARPRNSRFHDLSEMQPPLDAVLDSWKPWFAPHDLGPALLLDLSPRLSAAQRDEVEAMVDQRWPGLARMWVWTSRGRGRVDRLALWTGPLATPGVVRRFVRVPPVLGERPLVVDASEPAPSLNVTVHPPQRGEHVSLLDAALVESGLVMAWLSHVSKDRDLRWGVVEGRRPQLHHPHALRLEHHDQLMVQASGKVVALHQGALSDSSIQNVVDLAVKHQFASVKLRLATPPDKQPHWQGSLDRQLSNRNGHRRGFVAQHPNGMTLLLCVEPENDRS